MMVLISMSNSIPDDPNSSRRGNRYQAVTAVVQRSEGHRAEGAVEREHQVFHLSVSQLGGDGRE
jgi:hypothetical protein